MIKPYMKENKKLYEVYVAERDINKKLIAKRKRGITSEREAKEIEFQFKSDLRLVAEQKTAWTWDLWHQKFVDKMKISYKNSTIANYDGYLKKWIPKSWSEKPLDQVTSEDICELLKNSSYKLGKISQKNIVKMLNRIFQSAVDEGHILKNPAVVS